MKLNIMYFQRFLEIQVTVFYSFSTINNETNLINFSQRKLLKKETENCQAFNLYT